MAVITMKTMTTTKMEKAAATPSSSSVIFSRMRTVMSVQLMEIRKIVALMAVMDRMKTREYIDGVEILFVTESPEAIRELREVANGAMAIIGALNRMNEEIEADCPTCDYRVVCDTVDGLREMHAARSR